MRGAAGVGHHKTSMLQDLEAGQQLELDAIVTADVTGVLTALTVHCIQYS